MATFGSTVGTLDPSKDYLAQAIANSGQLVAGGIQQGAQGYAQGKQKQAEIKAQQEQKKLVMFQGEMEDANAEGLRLAQTQGADPAQVDAYLRQRKSEIRQKYGMIDGKPDNFAAINAPQQPQQQPQQQPPQAQPATQQAEPPQGAGGSFEGPQMTAPEPKQPTTAQPPALQAPLSAASIYAGARENVKKAEADKNAREEYENDLRTIRDQGGTEEVISKLPPKAREIVAKDPQLKQPENARALATYVRRYNKLSDDLIKIRQFQNNKDAGDRAVIARISGDYREDTKTLVKQLQENVPNLKKALEELRKNPNNNNAAQAAVKISIKLYDAGLVTSDEFTLAGQQAGVDFGTLLDRMKRNAGGNILTESSAADVEAMSNIIAGTLRGALEETNARFAETLNANGIDDPKKIGMVDPKTIGKGGAEAPRKKVNLVDW